MRLPLETIIHIGCYLPRWECDALCALFGVDNRQVYNKRGRRQRASVQYHEPTDFLGDTDPRQLEHLFEYKMGGSIMIKWEKMVSREWDNGEYSILVMGAILIDHPTEIQDYICWRDRFSRPRIHVAVTPLKYFNVLLFQDGDIFYAPL